MRRHRERAFTIAEVMCAFAVIAVATGMVVSLLASSRDAARRSVETRLAASIAQGAYERLRSGPHGALPPDGATVDLPLPPEAERLDYDRAAPSEPPSPPSRSAVGEPGSRQTAVIERLDGVRLTATSSPWPGAVGTRHLKVTLEWRPRRPGGREGTKPRRIVREGLVSDARAR